MNVINVIKKLKVKVSIVRTLILLFALVVLRVFLTSIVVIVVRIMSRRKLTIIGKPLAIFRWIETIDYLLAILSYHFSFLGLLENLAKRLKKRSSRALVYCSLKK